MMFELEQIDSGAELEYISNGLNDNYTVKKNKWNYDIFKNGELINRIVYNAMDAILNCKDKTGYYSIEDRNGVEVGFFDDIEDDYDKFALKVDNEIYMCDKDFGKFIIYKDGKILGGVKRSHDKELDFYKVLSEDDNNNIIMLMITTLIDLHWYSVVGEEVLNVRTDKEILDAEKEDSISIVNKYRFWRKFSDEEKMSNKYQDLGIYGAGV